MRPILVIILCCLQIVIVRAEDERIWIQAKVNGRDARFVFDTGDSDFYTLFRNGAERLGIAITNYTEPEDTNGIYVGYTPECSLKIQDQTLKVSFWVMDLPPSLTNYFSADGLIGWLSVTNCVVTIDARADTMLRSWSVPRNATGWLKLSVQTGAPVLRLLVPDSTGKTSVLVIDTGDSGGISLRSDLWRKWKSSHTNQPTTLIGKYIFGPGMTVREETWAKEIGFGPLTLTDVPVVEASPVDLGLGGEGYEATLGLTALKRLDLIVDSINGVAYLHPKNGKPPRYKHNRLAVCFAPQDLKSTNLVAQVLKDGPGYKAGIRDGDILLAVNGHDVSWNNVGGLSLISDTQRSGTKATLTLKRGTNVFKTRVVLKDILKP